MILFLQMGTLSRIFGSRKALFTLIAMGAAMAMAWTARITGREALDFMKWVLGAWIFAQAAEDGIMHWKGTHPGAAGAAKPTANPAPARNSDPPGGSIPPGASEAPPAS